MHILSLNLLQYITFCAKTKRYIFCEYNKQNIIVNIVHKSKLFIFITLSAELVNIFSTIIFSENIKSFINFIISTSCLKNKTKTI